MLAVPGFEPGSSGSQPLMLTTTLYHLMLVERARGTFSYFGPTHNTKKFAFAGN